MFKRYKILLSNDDGITSSGIWALARELGKNYEVLIIAPKEEQSACGTAITLRQPLRVKRIDPEISGIDTYYVEGTACDSVIIALEGIAKGKINAVVSGINNGLNLGDDVLVSGTVAAALQGYLRHLPSLAVSLEFSDNPQYQVAVRFTSILLDRVFSINPTDDIFLNINLPASPIGKINGLENTYLAHRTHIDTVRKRYNGQKELFHLVRSKRNHSAERNSDIWAIENGSITVTPLHKILFNSQSQISIDDLCNGLFKELKTSL